MINNIPVQLNEQYLAEWWHGYDNPEIEKEVITITNVYEDNTFDFIHKGSLNTNVEWLRRQIRGEIKLLKKIKNKEYILTNLNK